MWDALTGNLRPQTKRDAGVNCVDFSPTDSRLLLSAYDDHTVRLSDYEGHGDGPTYDDSHAAFSSDGTHFVSWGGKAATIRNTDSRMTVAELRVTGGDLGCCCFSPDGRLVAGASDRTIYVWDITSSDPYLVETFVGHISSIMSLVFSSSLISASDDKSVKFWQISGPSVGPAVTDQQSTPSPSAPITSISLQANDGIAISSDSNGVVRMWDILTGLCKESLLTQAKGSSWRDARLTDGSSLFVWLSADRKIRIRDAKKGTLQGVRTVDASSDQPAKDLRISGDGSRLFFLDNKSIRAWSTWTGDPSGEVMLEHTPQQDSLVVDGSRVWVRFCDSPTKGWDFGTPGINPVPLDVFPDRPRLDFINSTMGRTIGPSRIVDVVTGKEIFRLYGKYAKPSNARWDDRYLVAGYKSGEVLILDFNDMLPQ